MTFPVLCAMVVRLSRFFGGWDGHPIFNDGNPYFMGPYFHPYGLGLMSLSPIIWK